MNIKPKVLLLALIYVILAGLGLQAQPGTTANKPNDLLKSDTIAPRFTHFTPVTTAQKAPDAKGFIQRWLVLEPIKKNISRNSIFTDSYLRTTFSADNFSTDFTVVPKNGEKVKVGNQELQWHALDSKIFNCKLFRFPYGGNQPLYGVLFWTVTVINSPREIKNIRLSAGCNSSGMFWLNGKEALMLSGDRDLVVDNCTSSRLTLNKGKNIIRGAIINGPGMCDFCLRLLDDKGEPIKDFTITCE
jgi:hypothetical protein